MTITGNYVIKYQSDWIQLPLQEIYLECDTSLAPVIINLFKINETNRFWNITIHISDISNNANSNNITVVAGAGDTIDDVTTSSLVINNDGGSAILQIANDTSWIALESVTGGSTPAIPIYIDKTYTELQALITAGNLVKGAMYQITDFQTIYDQPDYDINGIQKTFVIKTATVEPLVVQATSSNTISSQAFSTIHPLDTIEYNHTSEVLFNSVVSTKGKITKRIDVVGNTFSFDFRNILFLRYETINGSGVFDSYKDTGFTSVEVGVFGVEDLLLDTYQSSFTGNEFLPSTLTPFGGYRQQWYLNTVLFTGAINNRVGGQAQNNTTQLNFVGNTITTYFINNIIDTDFKNNVIGDFFTNNTVGANFKNNIIIGNFSDHKGLLNIGQNFENNYIGYSCEYNKFNDGFKYNTLVGETTSNIFGANAENNNLGAYLNQNTFGEGFQDNTIGNFCDGNDIGNSFTGNSIGIFFENNTIVASCFDNTIVASFSGNQITGNFNKNQILCTAQNNTFDRLVSSVLKGDDFSGNTLEIYTSEIFCESFTGNTAYFEYSNVNCYEFNNNTISYIGNCTIKSESFNTNILPCDFLHNNITTKFFNSNSISNIFRGNLVSGTSFSSNDIDTVIDNKFLGNFTNNNGIGFLNNIMQEFIGNIIEGFQNNNVQGVFEGNTILQANDNTFRFVFSYNNIGLNLNLNIFDGFFASNTILDNFQGNSFLPSANVGAVDFSLATHVYLLYDCEIRRKPDGTLRLCYLNNADVYLTNNIITS